MEFDNFFRMWPGKSLPDGKTYPAACHMLDVAAVAEILIQCTLLTDEQKDSLVLLTALHDLGKFSSPFRDLIEGRQPQSTKRHWEFSELLLIFLDDGVLGPVLGGKQVERNALYAATSGHHGKPPVASIDDFRRMKNKVGAEAVEDASKFARFCVTLWSKASLAGLTEIEFLKLSWWLPGFVTVCDWVGSNTDWFPPVAYGATLSEHFAASREKAKRAVIEAGLGHGAAKYAALYDFDLRPMQQAAKDILLRDGPMLAIIEDETGAGKTEAAMLLAQRMLLSGKGNGIFFALPTMATSNAMFKRADKTVGKLFDAPSLTLAHGRANLSVDFNDVKGREPGDDDDVTCAPWLTDGRRRALLAQVGVGTIDQALLSILPTKHNCLRIWGLSQKILVVDEVHELGNPYMEEELKVLLQSHAMQGGSAILLSATLPLNLRQRLADAYEEGAGRNKVPMLSNHYPSLIISSGRANSDLRGNPSPRGKVRVERIGEAATAAKLLVEASQKGAACVWVRNSVDEAISAKEMLEALGAAPLLFHARFAFGDRQRTETEVLKIFGRDRASGIGKILVATQVVESSLDLDFDVMVSDLAPMAALIQRTGRLWRHMEQRPAHMRPVAAPVLQVLSPDPGDVKNQRWLKDVLGKGEFVYAVAEQWRTAKHLFAVGAIDAPGNLRELIEVVHGHDVADVPDVLLKAEMAAEGEYHAQRNRGQQNTIDLSKYFRTGAAAHDDVSYPTRLGPPQRTLMLVRREAGELRLLSGKGAEGEMLSEVSVAKHRLDKFELPEAGEEAPELQAFKKHWPKWKQGNTTVVEVASDGKIARGLDYSADNGLVFHNLV